MSYGNDFEAVVARAGVAGTAYRFHEEKRGYPRVDMHIPASITLGDGRRCVGRMRNLSPDGFQLCCDNAAARKIHPRSGLIAPNTGPVVQATFRVRVGKEDVIVSARCRATYQLDMPDGDIMFGFAFKRFDADGEAILQRFVDEVSEPARPACSG